MSNTPELRKKTVKGVQWNGIGYALYYLINLAGTAVLSRLVLPEDFGSLGMLTVLVTITAFLVSLGLDFAVIQNRDLTEEDFSSFFWINILLGLLFTIAFFLGSQSISDFYNQSSLLWPARAYSIIFLIQAIGVVPQAILGKTLDFRKRVLAQLIGLALSYAVAIPMAQMEYGIWALVAQVFIFNLVHVLLNLFFLGWMPKLQIRKSSFLKIKDFGTHFMAFQLLDVVAVNIDSLLIGKFLGAKEVAYFGRSVALVMMPVLGLSMVFIKTFYSFFSAIQHDTIALKKEFSRAGELIVFIAAPILLSMSVFSTEIVVVLFGDQWVPMANVLSVLAIPAIVTCYFGLTDSFLTSIGQVKVLARASLIEKSIYFIFIVIGLRFGIMGLAYAKLLAILFTSAVKFYLLQNSIQLTISDWAISLKKNFIGLTTFLISCLLFQFLLPDLNSFVKLIVAIVVSSSVYLLVLYYLKSEILFRGIGFVKEKLNKPVL